MKGEVTDCIQVWWLIRYAYFPYPVSNILNIFGFEFLTAITMKCTSFRNTILCAW
jgi:hypothetical protein